jgi:two-component system sensor histidine kinase TctE
VRPQDVEIRPLLEEIAHLSIDASRVTVDCDPDVHFVTDPVILRHLVNQLVDNALKYAGDAEVTCTVTEDGPRIVVRDHGPGIPEAERGRVFERFYRGNHTGAGMGLGLPVVRQLAASLDATVHLDDAPGGGARFTLRFEHR